jgi:16S rRNA (cytosine967-C5)-methyltransferase
VSTRKPREIAFRVLLRREQTRRYVEELLTDEFHRAALPPSDRYLAQELTYGVVRWEATLDWLISQKALRPPPKLATGILLRLGLYQIFWLDRIPDHAAVNEMVALSKRVGASAQAGFINAILRGYIRQKENTRHQLDKLRINHPALSCSHPEWLYSRWERRWGSETALKLMDWNNSPPNTCVRVNSLRVKAPQLAEIWKREGVQFEPFERDWIPANLVFKLVSHPPLNDLESFRQGFFYVQDPSTLLAVTMLDPRPGQRVLDLCAAPGGKTSFIAQLMDDQGHIAARDIDPRRLQLARENFSRMGITCAEIPPAQHLHPHPPKDGAFDRALVDAPCSNTGVMRRRLDLRWRIAPDEITRLKDTQLLLLSSAAAQVKPGGLLVYSTCSLEEEENQHLTAAFLEQNSAFKLDAERQVTPFSDDVDGAYVARFSR